jgi:hypothetical protein
MNALWKFLPWAGVVLAVLMYGCERERAGELRGSVAELTRERDALVKAGQVVRREFIRDTITVTRTRTRYETIRDSLITTDTLLRTDTAFIAVTQAADTAIRACQSVVSTCSRALALADSIHVVDTRTIRAMQRARPGIVRRWGERIAWAAVGYTVGSLTK